ncbi:TonB-dependent hemoglobin/transferrin/lactoferrin family receptor [Idiomarina sp. Sol25]|uniref:TonB-dependent hemoglobin/transferrin/lactoferrin family receptor n=1 Tax=Idiomarina sp. Sol25 TaxID=3064000 RepID=UPI00294B7470|nr:TonB-dependent hemoglobin/transferrin/lactoferrin family receptor [Idiomarina sp. Sol25]MDV6328166.1 TonB-dependent hemoglobin/transferrin/lactoferrin family receptor [Idiomarina sp. Sol25]
MNKRHKTTRSFAKSLLATAIFATLQTTVYAADLAKPTLETDEILVVTGSRSKEKLEEVAGAVSVVTAEEIDIQVSNSLSDIFRYDPSISSTGSQGQAQTLSIRGIGGNRVVYIKDGRRLNDAYAGGGGYLVGRGYLDVSQLSQVEVAKAAASPLYGSDGLGGVIVLTTPDPDDMLQGESNALSLQAGFDSIADERSLGVQAAKQFSGSQTSIQLTARKGNETQNYEESLPKFDYDSVGVLAKWAIALENNNELKFTLDHYQQSNEQLQEPPEKTEDEDKQTAFSIDYLNNNSNWLTDTQHWQLYLSHYEQNSDQIAQGANQGGPYIDNNDYGFEQRIIGARWQGESLLPGNQVEQDLVFGFDVDYYDTERPRFKTRTAADGTLLQDNEPQKAFPGAETWLAGLFLQDNIQLKNMPLKFIAGVRIDHYRMTPQDNALYDMSLLSDIRETALSPKLAAIYTFSNDIRGYLQYAEGFKIPPHDQAYQNHGIEPFYAILPNPDLDPESSRSLETGLKFADNNTRWNLSAFYSKFDDFIDTQVVGTSPTYIPGVDRVEYQYINKDEVTIKGVEASVTHWLNDNIQLASSVAYTTGKDETTDDYLTTLSPLSGNASVGYHGNDWYVRGVVTAVDSMSRVPADESIHTPGYTTVDVLAGITLTNWQVNLAARNLTDKYYVPYQSVAGLQSEASTEQYSQPGRSFGVQVKYTF